MGSSSTASAAEEDIHGYVNDYGDWVYYKTQRCAKSDVYIYMTQFPNGNSISHRLNTQSNGGGHSWGGKYIQKGDKSKRYLGPKSGNCFYWQAKDYPGWWPSDSPQKWAGKVRYR
ncbi:hypothetical protein AB0E21_10425 [Streptomyces sp. NPDC047967]|uniref:hypothetical protein n=1 Tax=Streptomyces sp. NPDC047967 TaxID=3154924 RepID=UPI0033F784D0